MDQVDNLNVMVYRGVHLVDIEEKIKRGEFNLEQFSYIILHVGTNDINTNKIHKIMANFRFLLKVCLQHSDGSKTLFSSILPRPVDIDKTKVICSEINIKLSELCLRNNVKSYKRFLVKGQYVGQLFSYRDGLHQSYEGTTQLRWCFINTIPSSTK